MPQVISVFNQSQTLLNLYRLNLAACGYRVYTHFQNGDVLKWALQDRPDLVILGYLAGHMADEIAFVYMLRKGKIKVSSPILFCSTSEYNARDASLIAGMPHVYVLQRPFSTLVLASFVEEILGSSSHPANL